MVIEYSVLLVVDRDWDLTLNCRLIHALLGPRHLVLLCLVNTCTRKFVQLIDKLTTTRKFYLVQQRRNPLLDTWCLSKIRPMAISRKFHIDFHSFLRSTNTTPWPHNLVNESASNLPTAGVFGIAGVISRTICIIKKISVGYREIRHTTCKNYGISGMGVVLWLERAICSVRDQKCTKECT